MVGEDSVAVLEAYCRAAMTALPRGVRGLEAAQIFLRAFPEVCRRGFGDHTDSAPGFFGILVELGLIESVPSANAMTAGIRLVASSCELVTPRSERRWTAWFGSAGDPGRPIGARVRGEVSEGMLSASATPPGRGPPRRGGIRAERDRLAGELAVERAALTSAREAVAAASAERDLALTALEEQKAASSRWRSEAVARGASLDEVLNRLDVERSGFEVRASEIGAERDRAVASLDAANAAILGLSEELERVRAEGDRQRRQCLASKERSERAEGEVLRLRERIEAVERSAATNGRAQAEALGAVRAERDALARAKEGGEAEIQVLSAQVRSQRESLARSEERSAALSSEVKLAAAREATLREELRAATQQLDATRRRLTESEERGRAAAAELRHFEGVDLGLLRISMRLGLATEEEMPPLSAIVAGLERHIEAESRFRERVRRELRRAYVRLSEALLEVTIFRAACPDVSVDGTAERLSSMVREQGREKAKRVFEELLAGDSDEGRPGGEEA